MLVRHVYRTGDGGATWSASTLSADPNFIPGDVSAVSASTAWVAGSAGVFVTTDLGLTWRRTSSWSGHLAPLSEQAAWAVRSGEIALWRARP